LKTNRQKLGKKGEEIAANFLESKGYSILHKNFRTQYGEIDLIAQLGKELVFIEVKTRTSKNYGYPEDSINQRKQEHILASSQAYLQQFSELSTQWRVDVVSILFRSGENQPEIVHFENAITI
jgi:putative endonuclease